MTLYEYYIIFPDGEEQEVFKPIPVGGLLDMNGQLLPSRLPSNKMLAYQVVGKRTSETRGIVKTFYTLEQLDAQELLDFV